ncbi:FKBP-type peptidylprolyl isomerase [Spirosoma aureum]|uniref:Peptidyl-prolyl cis-trans isomerase n=1 Tax=Spirosoma aureum TaxID=2692134 RepID=A0A6G9AI99_9BACT|nr:FKBP-type peptidyl-prolyl cis-trans isomerase [Spirosoma aureum]QIP12064.1 FKBP-type peptidylprolyl isomerase [Spirosoma aureum]
MKPYILVLLLGAMIAVSCQSGDQSPCTQTTVTTKAPQEEVAALKKLIDSHKISALLDERGFYYHIQSPGSGAKPTVCSTVTVNYTGTLTSGTTFDSGSGVRFGLDQLIVGWQEGIPLITPGGSIILYLPPSLAYGPQAQEGIPANSILIFKIDLLKAE